MKKIVNEAAATMTVEKVDKMEAWLDRRCLLDAEMRQFVSLARDGLKWREAIAWVPVAWRRSQKRPFERDVTIRKLYETDKPLYALDAEDK